MISFEGPQCIVDKTSKQILAMTTKVYSYGIFKMSIQCTDD